jgi:hypothetical protein
MKRILKTQLILAALVVFFSIGVQPVLAQPSLAIPSHYKLLFSTDKCVGCGTTEARLDIRRGAVSMMITI